MAAFEQDFDASKVDPKKALVPVPVGDYISVITDSEEKPNSKGTGSYHQFTWEIIEGDYKGRKLWTRLNLSNPSDQAVSIARAELSAICRAVGVMKPKDSTDLHNLPCKLKVGMRKNKETGELGNEIKGYSPRDGSTSTTAPAAKEPPKTPPWKKTATNGGEAQTASK